MTRASATDRFKISPLSRLAVNGIIVGSTMNDASVAADEEPIEITRPILIARRVVPHGDADRWGNLLA